jgi:Holliday junction resolvase RusA-like endonuclease
LNYSDDAQTFVIHGSMPTLNETIRATKSHWSRYAAEKRRYTEAVAWTALKAKLRPVTAPVEITFVWFSRNRRADPDNIRYAAKHILDGLQVAHVLPNDNQKWIRGFHDCFEIDKTDPRVEVTLREIAG